MGHSSKIERTLGDCPMPFGEHAGVMASKVTAKYLLWFKRNYTLKGELRKKDAEAERQLKLKKELVELKAECDRQLSTYFHAHLNAKIAKINEMYNALDLIHWDSSTYAIRNFDENYENEHFNLFKPHVFAVHASQDQINSIATESLKGKYASFCNEYNKALSQVKHDILDRLPSCKEHLETIKATKDKSDQDAIIEQQKKRQEEDKKKLDEQATARQKTDSQKIETEKTAAITGNLFEAQTIAQSAPKQVGQVKEGYEIKVFNPIGYLVMFQFYMEYAGKTEELSKFEKKTLGSVKTWCEKYALKNGVKCDETYLKYEEKLKTVAK